MNIETSTGSALPRAGYAWYMVALLLLAYMLSFIDRQIIALLVDPIRRDLAITDFQFSLLHGLAFSIFFALMGMPIAQLADRYTRKWIIAIGVLLWSLMTALSGLADTFTELFLARIGVGIGEAALAPAAYSLVADAFERRVVPKAMAVFSVGSTLGSGLAFVVGGAVIQLTAGEGVPAWLQHTGLKPWQLAFFIAGVPGIALALLIAALREPPRQRAAAPAASGIGEAWRHGVALRAVYLPLFFGMAANTAISSGFILWFPSHLIRNLGFAPADAGQWFGLLFMACASSGVLAGGWLASRWESLGHRDSFPRVMAVAVAVALLPYALSTRVEAPALALALMGVAVFCTQSLAGVSVTAIQVITPNRLRAKVSSVYLLFCNLVGFSLGAPSIAWLSDRWLGGGAAIGAAISWAALLYVPLALVCFQRARRAFATAPRQL
jgi:MFS family permease